MDRVLLIDGLNMIHRSNISFGSKSDDDKPSYTIVYNFFRSLKASVEYLQPQKIFFALEGSNNFRYALYPEYKSHRIIKQGAMNPDKRDNIFRQADLIKGLLSYLPITLAKADRYEADDVIATLATNLKDEECIVFSTDSDYVQMLQDPNLPNVRLYNPIAKAYVDKPVFHYLLWKTLRGDKKTDNIRGLMSDAKALKMVNDPEALKDFLSIEENKAAFNLNRNLIELQAIPEEELQLTAGKTDFDTLKSEFDRMELPTMTAEKYWANFREVFEEL